MFATILAVKFFEYYYSKLRQGMRYKPFMTETKAREACRKHIKTSFSKGGWSTEVMPLVLITICDKLFISPISRSTTIFRAFGLFGFGGGRLRVGVVPVYEIAAAVEFRVVQVPTKFQSNPVSVRGK